MSKYKIEKEQVKMTKETEKQINDLIMAMAKDPQNIDNYHKLSEFYLQMED